MRPIITILFLFCVVASWAQSIEKANNEARMTTDKIYPFQLKETNGRFEILVPIESPELFEKYFNFFEQLGYSGNGYCWEGHITQILEKTDKELLRHLQFDPEAGAFFAYADSRDNQLRFINILSPIFSDLKKLEEYVRSADRRRIDD